MTDFSNWGLIFKGIESSKEVFCGPQIVQIDLTDRCNNNCIGCCKGGMWYWNKIRVDFPEVFKLRAQREREIGHTYLKDKNGKIFLDELEPNRGRKSDEILETCGVMCELNL